MSGKRKPVLQRRSVEDDSLIEEGEDGEVVVLSPSPYDSPYSVSSPDSTASGPTYGPRQPGFQHHAHQEDRNKKNTKNKKFAETAQTIKPKTKRDPLPMKLRALPHSFWQQPNQPTNVSPGSVFPVLPPLYVRDRGDAEASPHEPLIITQANTDLLFSLFSGIEQDEGPPRPPVVRRGRPRKPPSQLMSRVLKDDDPCLGSAAGPAALPVLMPSRNSTTSAHQQMMAMLSMRDGESLSLPSLGGIHHQDQCYSTLLSELVVRL